MSFYLYPVNTFPYVQSIQYIPSFTYQIPTMTTTFQQGFDYVISYPIQAHTDFHINFDKNQTLNQLQRDKKYQKVQYAVDVSKQKKSYENRKEKKNIQKQISSAKKNSQSNIVNQFYSFFSSRQKSQKIVTKAVEATLSYKQNQQKVINLFYNTIREINRKRGRKYVNRIMLKNYFTPQDIQINLPQFKNQIEKLNYITLEQLCQIFRRCCQVFLKIVSIPAILTSKRITGISKQQHFKKRRKILKAITEF